MQKTNPHHPIIHIPETSHIPQKPITIHMPTPEPKRRPPLHFPNNRLTPNPSHSEANHRNAKMPARRLLTINSDPAIGIKEIQENGL